MGDAGSAVGSPSELCALNRLRRPRGLRAFHERLAFGATVSRPSEWMSTVELDRIGVRVVGLSRAPPLTSASTLLCGVPSRFARRRAFRPPRDDPGLCISVGDTPGSRSSFPGHLTVNRQTLLVCAFQGQIFLFASFSLGVVQDFPSIDLAAARPLWVEPRFNRRHWSAKTRARSVLAFPPGFDGLLRASACRFVAPCCRPWGSPCFQKCFGCEVPFACVGAQFPVQTFAARPRWVPHSVLARQPDPVRTDEAASRRGFPRPDPALANLITHQDRRLRRSELAARCRVPCLPGSVATFRRCRRRALQLRT